MTCWDCGHEMTLTFDGNRQVCVPERVRRRVARQWVWVTVGCGWVLVTPLHGFRTVEAQT